MATVLSNFGAPTINDIAAQRVLSNTLLENIYQGIIEKDGEGVTQRFSADVSGAQIRIIHVKPITENARELGATINGGNFPTSTQEGGTDSLGIDVITVLDDPIDLANVTKDMIPVDLAGQYMKTYSDLVNVNLNAMTIAGKYYATFLKQAQGGEVNVTTYAGGTANLKDSVISANTLLDEGAPDMGVTMFPQEDRCFVLQNMYRPVLLSTGILVVGGANYAYDIQEKGTISVGATPRKREDGYIGTLDNVPCHIVSPYVLQVAGKYLGLALNDVKHAIGYVSSAYANVRAIAAPRDIKVIDCPQGQGTRFQPLTRMGFKVLEGYEKSNSFIVDSLFTNVYGGLNTLFTLNGNYASFSYRAPGSRVALSPVATSSASTKVTITSALASKIAIVAVASTTTISDVTGFLAAYTAAGATAKAADAVSGTEKTLAGATAGMVAYGLAMAADGTCALCHVTVAS